MCGNDHGHAGHDHDHGRAHGPKAFDRAFVSTNGPLPWDFLRDTADALRIHFGIAHATFQVEQAGVSVCTLPLGCGT